MKVLVMTEKLTGVNRTIHQIFNNRAVSNLNTLVGRSRMMAVGPQWRAVASSLLEFFHQH